MALNLKNSFRDGQGFSGNEPVYYKFVPGDRIEYYFHYGSSQTLLVTHEGDWEHIAIRLNDNNQPLEVEYWMHYDTCTLSWQNTPKSNGHPTLWIAAESHGSYPTGAISQSGDRIEGGGTIWDARKNLDPWMDASWYGYAGGWGQAGAIRETSGPWGPNPLRGKPGWPDDRCDMN